MGRPRPTQGTIQNLTCCERVAVFKHSVTHVYKFVQITYSVISAIFFKNQARFEMPFYFMVVTNRKNTHRSAYRILLVATLTTRAKRVRALIRVPCFIA